ncbi:MAG TPA: hypothetical protein VN633_03020 [Bryobacteraceae bacterium]|nr:hypothetical protein [Bryobacteraceae bacterium]
MKNPSTAWGGYAVGIDAETVNWIGSDGTPIRTVPRYACEELLDTWRTEAQTGSRAFARKCIAHGIAHPAGMCFQDLVGLHAPQSKAIISAMSPGANTCRASPEKQPATGASASKIFAALFPGVKRRFKKSPVRYAPPKKNRRHGGGSL